MDWKKGMFAFLLLIVAGGIMAQLVIDNNLSAGQTNYKTVIEKELSGLSESRTLADCTPILVNVRGDYMFDTNGTGCPPGIFEINEGELLLKIVALENRVDDLNTTTNRLIIRIEALEKG